MSAPMRIIPESTDEFLELFARRQDLESLNEDYESGLRNRRSRRWLKHGQQFDLYNFGIYMNLKALAAYQTRTGDAPLERAA
jgi:hypothetical protein